MAIRKRLRRSAAPRVVSIRGAALPIPAVNAEVVETLRRLLHEAESGNIAGFVYGAVSPVGHIDTGWSGNADAHGMTAAVAILFHRVLDA